MNINVYKFGGTYLNNIKSLNNILKFLKSKIKKEKVILIVSAIGREKDAYSTSSLRKESSFLSNKEHDRLLALGEIYSSLKLSSFLNSKDINTYAVSIKEAGLISDDNFLDANIIEFNKENLYSLLNEYSVLIIPGFQALTKDEDITTLGHGGSDYTASVVSSLTKENKVYLHKDVPGVLSSNLPFIFNKVTLDHLSYDQALTYFNYSGDVVCSKALEYSKENNILIDVFNLESKKHTLISNKENEYCFYGLTILYNKIYLFGKTDEYTVAILKDYLRTIKSIKYIIHVGFIEIELDKSLLEEVSIKIHKHFIE